MTNNSPGNTKEMCFPAVYLFFTIALSIIINGCADNPSSLGLNFLKPGDTTSVKIFDSRIDSMPITFKNTRKYINTSSSNNLITGQTGSYNSKALIKFTSIDSHHDSATVNSATLTLKYKNYYFPISSADSLAQVSFDVFTVQQNINYTNFIVDSVTSTTFGTTSQGTYTGTPTADSQAITINLNTSMVKDWLSYAANSNYPVVNNGLVLIPNPSSAVLKAFYSSALSTDIRPTLTIVATKNGVTDTLITRDGQSVSLVTATLAKGIESFPIQAGIAYWEIMKFDLSKLPPTATINDVQLYLTLDSANSKFTSQTTQTIIPAYITDTAGLVLEGLPNTYNGNPVSTGSSLYSFRIIYPFQRWLQGQTNYGIVLRPYNQNTNLDLFYFYNSSASDPNKRPRVVIKYTPRITP
jgi:hypothetical protein